MKRLCLFTLILLTALSMCGCEPTEDIPSVLQEAATDDFTHLFRSADRQGSALVSITVTEVESVTDVIEYYNVDDTTYTRVLATVDRDFGDKIHTDTLTLMILGTKENFPLREEMVAGRSYLVKLDPWVHETGLIWLLSPLESTYLRIFEGEIMVHESAADLNYKKAMTPDAFAASYAEYQTVNTPDATAQAQYYKRLLETVQNYDYRREALNYQLSDTAIAARLALAEQLAK